MTNSGSHSKASRTVLITGAAQRIGRTLSLAFADAGWRVAVHYRSSAEEAAQLVEQIRRNGGEADMIGANLADADDTLSLVTRCAETIGTPACLINNASLFLEDELTTVNCENWQTHMDTNLRAPILLAQTFAAHLPPGENGNVVNIIDQRVLKPAPDFFSYTASKAGLWWATRTMAQALAPRIRVNAVSPGPVLPSIHQSGDDFEVEVGSTLLRKSAPAEEIAAAVRFLVESPSITGQMICVDSGQHLS